MFLNILILSIFSGIDAVPLNLQSHRASQVVDSENFHYRNNNPVLCKKGLFSCFQKQTEIPTSFPKQKILKKDELDASSTLRRNLAFENPKVILSKATIDAYVDNLKIAGKFTEAQEVSNDFAVVKQFLTLNERILLNSETKLQIMVDNINDIILYQKFIQESPYATPVMIRNWKIFQKDYNEAKLDFILKTPKILYTGNDVNIKGIDVTLREKLGEGAFGIAYKAYIPSTKSFAVVKFPKHIHEESLQNEHNALLKTKMLIAWDDKFKISIQKYIEGVNLQSKMVNLLSKNTAEAKLELAVLKAKYENLPTEFAEKYGLNHEDIAPRNTIVDANGDLHLIDFGMTSNIPENVNIQQYVKHSKEIADLEWFRTTLRPNYIKAKQDPDLAHSKNVIVVMKATLSLIESLRRVDKSTELP